MSDLIKIGRKCPMCGEYYTMRNIDESKLCQYEAGNGYIQDIFPEFNPMEREFIKTGYCPKCQKRLFFSDYKSKNIRKSI